ncbi:hypothetical protein DL546_003785 [Coniochaeta pulveracea]|uniref:dolichol kinase n=1 Tax=Coniochaeta pulveracea TaxID=177199 RepID=A0A420Y3L5_9PEZI|nr:hypothetical protein DL546_003785 [Coniochaeta pulveracea]
MQDTLELPDPSPVPAAITDADAEELDILRRSPHPYHRQKTELLEPSGSLTYGGASLATQRSGYFTKESSPGSESGTEADDEHILKGLPAPRPRRNKGLRGMNEELPSGTSTPLPSPAVPEQASPRTLQHQTEKKDHNRPRKRAEKYRRRKEVVRRAVELALLACLARLVQTNAEARFFVVLWKKELSVWAQLLLGLLALYPVRLTAWAYRSGKPSKTIPISIPSTFDPAPVLYPQIIPVLAALLVAQNVPDVILPNLMLSLCTLPGALIPTARSFGPSNPVHWFISCIPLFLSNFISQDLEVRQSRLDGVSVETLVLLYPLHRILSTILQYLTTTSLLTAELQLLSVGLINILLLSYSPQAAILKALLWIGGVGILTFCGGPIQWGVSLARVPKWRFSRTPAASKGPSISRLLRSILLFIGSPKHGGCASDLEESDFESGNTSDEDYCLSLSRASSAAVQRAGSIADGDAAPPTRLTQDTAEVQHVNSHDIGSIVTPFRRRTLPSFKEVRSKTHTPSGRRKRAASSTVRSFFSLTYAQATARKWLYACYVYSTIVAIVLVGVRSYIQCYALSGAEPIGWALGYLLGDLPRFRFQVVNANLERWILLPSRSAGPDNQSCHLGRIAHLRHSSLGEANTRLVLSAYFLLVIATGLAIVFRLSPVCEVDTRRKVFHFMMVAMFLPATFADPTFCALGLAVVLAVFLLLDLVRASQLPPFSKPIANFLTPYVDGRDLRGPVVVSHIFLLIGCAIPLWLSLAALPRMGEGALKGWEVPTRDVSMVSGVVCVGLGDAAASLIGRRWGRRKWLWGGGKSIEGSVAFALAVFGGLMAAAIWLKVGGWPVSGVEPGLDARASWWPAVGRMGLCASVASLTEAVLTGGNDNVVVPIVLWTCVKSTGI